MVLRNSSAPILRSLLLFKFKVPSLEPEHTLKLPRTIIFLSLSQNKTKIDLKNSSSPKKTTSLERNEVKEDKMVQTSMMGGGMKNNGGCKGGGIGSDGGNGRGWNFNEENNHGRDKIDSYYQNMIETHPCDALLLGNYAKFLKEVCGDYTKAKEYLERAIMANPGDGRNLSIYGDLIWQIEKNAARAQQYFDQAIQNDPNDCHVLASYAKFLWDGEDEEDKDFQVESNQSHHFQETKHFTHLTAAS